MLNSWFRALRDPTPSASGPDERESRGEHISSTLYESSSGVKVVSLRGGEGESGQRASNEGEFGGEMFVRFTLRRGSNEMRFCFWVVT